jgi:hypothetical protein
MENKYTLRLGKQAALVVQAEQAFLVADVGYTMVMARAKGPNFVFTKEIDGVTVKSPAGTFKGANIMDALNKATQVEDATLAVAGRARSYNLKNNRIAVHLWGKDAALLRVLKEVFGGNYYRHGSGYLWICSKRDQLERVWEAVQPHLDEEAKNRLGPLMSEFT